MIPNLKNQLGELAIFGCEPAFAKTHHVGRPNIGNRKLFLEYVNQIMDSRWLTNNGPLVQELEQRLAEFLGVKQCITMCNATIGLEIAIRALGMRGEVIVPSFTFVATAHALQWQEITPVFVDVDPATHNLDPAKIEQLLTPRTTGLIGVHVWGRPCDTEALATIAEQYDLKLLYDAAHAFGGSNKRQMIGNFGDAEVFSFHATKFFNSFEGGAVTTNDDELAERIRLMRNFGFAGLDSVIYIGTNGKMSEVSAAMGLVSLESISEFIEKNRQNYLAYMNGLKDIPGCKLITFDESRNNNYQYIVVEIDETNGGLNRDELVTILHAENIKARRYFYPGCHQMEPYISFYPNAGLLLPETERLVKRVLCLPTGMAVDRETVQQICKLMAFCMTYGPEIKGAMQSKKDKERL